ncbi:Acetylcholine receptor subunit beta-like 1 [Pseudolycoriella hygida]|uniref:Acetylcholine receptor subunit beta-like 1 n=1 Tax=Pseudolycoriella hygida TaxID=35572 RepID=A0A9Q0MRX0_9DIPT|nr:Acetylcholine receptor subunit beta-like 1 [Pseudolycoriella hygida]
MSSKRETKPCSTQPTHIWKVKPPGPEQKELERMFREDAIEPWAAPDVIRRSCEMFRRFNPTVFANHFRATKAKLGLAASVCSEKKADDPASRSLSDIPELGGLPNLQEDNLILPTEDAQLIQFTDPPFWTWVHFDHERNIELVNVAVVAFSGVKDFNFCIDDDGLRIHIDYFWPSAIIRAHELFQNASIDGRKISIQHPKIHSDEADYGGIGVLRLPPDKVWKPDIVLFNNADGNYEVRYKSNVLIYPNGEVLWVPPAIYQSSCTIDVTYFPFDQQTCIMKFGSWTFNGDQVSLALYNNKNFVDLSDYWKSGTWDIIEVPAYLNVYSEGNQPTETDITFYIIIRRKTLFYTVNLILPTVLISFLCVLVFYLPAEAGEKVTLGISILLSLVVFLLLVSKILPPTSLVLPLIAKYLLFTFIMNTVSILVTVVIINWNFRGPRTHRMPMWIRTVFLHYLPAMLLMKRPRKTRLRWMMEMPGMSVPPHPNPYGSPTELPKHISSINAKQAKMEVMELSDLHHPNCKINRKINCGGDLGGVTDSCRRESESSDSILLSPEASKATEAVEFIAEHLRNEDLYIQTREDWKYVAMVIDRLQLYIFFIVTTAGTVGILMDAPHIFEYVDQDRIIEIYRGK